MMYLIKTNKAFNKDFILYSIVLLSLFFIALTTLNAQSKPDAPTIELVQVQATHTTVQWNPVTDATFYYIFVCNETNQCNIGILYDANHNQKTTPYLQTITPLTPNTSYSITITAYANNQWSDYSNWIHIKTKKEDTIPLTQQTNQGQQNQQNNPQTPQQPEQQQSPQQDQQQGGVQQQTPQQQDDPNACRWVVQSRGTPYSECSNNKELISEYTPTTYVCGGADNCQGNCGDSIKGSIRQADDRTGSTDCSATNQFCSADITGVRCVSPKCEWIDKRKTENKVCLTKKNVFIEPQQEQVCGTPGCQGTCWDIENGNFWDSTERRYVSFRNVERPQGYTRTLPQRQGTRIDRCKVTEECKNGSCVTIPRAWRCNNGRNCEWVNAYKLGTSCPISPPNPVYRCATPRFNQWNSGPCTEYETTPSSYECFKTCHTSWSDGVVTSNGNIEKLTGTDHNNLCLSQLP